MDFSVEYIKMCEKAEKIQEKANTTGFKSYPGHLIFSGIRNTKISNYLYL